MALKPLLKLVGISETSAYITVADNTGDYGAGNTGGWGTPNPAKADVTGIILQLASFANLKSYTAHKVPNAAAFLASGGYQIGVEQVDGAFGSDGFADGVYDIKYDVLFALGTIDITPGGTAFTLANADTLLANAAGIVLTGYDGTRVYYIDFAKGLTATGGHITENFPIITASQAANVVYEGSLQVLMNKNGNNCLVADIATWSDHGCEDLNYHDIMKRYQMKIAIEAKFSKKLLYDAHNMAVKLASYCNPNCDCGC